MLELIPAFLGAAAGICLIAALLLRSSTGLPWAAVRHDDAGTRRDLSRNLVSRRYGIVGKPDYLLERGSTLIPVEVKPGRDADHPYPADLAQLAAYLLLVEETSGRRPPYGLLRYRHKTFRLRNTARVRKELLATLDEMRELLDATDAERSHDEAVRCLACALRSVCGDQRLT